MKIQIDIEPHELRDLLGLPDTKVVQEALVERAREWVGQQQQDSELAERWVNAIIEGGRQSFDAYQAFLANFTSGGKAERAPRR